ncbi:MAG: peptidylprolyl isomerase [Bacteroidaceae bacterium]|nr:peptidylprolyl isomerase [Bacteroidaceae bacterium]
MKNSLQIVLRYAAVLLVCWMVIPCVHAKKKEKRSVVLLETTMGNIRVVLSDDTPRHRDNFLRLVEEGFYDSLLFHRVIADFMVQTGDPTSRAAQPRQRLGEGTCDYTIPAEFNLPYLYHWRGALAAARESDDVNPEMRSSGCQFYIVWGRKQTPADIKRARSLLSERGEQMTPQMADDYERRGGTPHLDGAYTVFGEVVEGLDVVKRMQKVPTDEFDRPVEDVRILKATVENRSKAAK